VTAIVCGKLSVADMVPPATTKAGKAPEVRDAVMRAWPLVMQIMLEVHPRDDTAQAVMLKLALDVFAQAHVASDPVETLLKPVLEEMRTTSALYLLDGGAEHSWQVTMDNSMAEALQSMALRSSLAGAAPALPAGLPLSAQQQQARAVANAAEKKRLADAAGTGKQPAAEGAGLDSTYVSYAKYNAMTGKEKGELNAKRDALREAAAAGKVTVPK
jgi:L-rhamnose isomerase